jgi:hypothetical protein
MGKKKVLKARSAIGMTGSKIEDAIAKSLGEVSPYEPSPYLDTKRIVKAAMDVHGSAWDSNTAKLTQEDIELISELERKDRKKKLERGEYRKKTPLIPMK